MAIYTPTTSNSVRLSTLVNVVKDKYNENVPMLIPSVIKLWEYFKPKTETFEGEGKFIIEMQTALNESSTATKEMIALSDARITAFDYGYLYMKKVMSRMVLSKELIDLSKGQNAIVKGFENLTESTIKPWMYTVEAFMHLNGSSYVASSATSDSSGAAATVTCTVDSTRFLRKGMNLQAYDSSNNHDATDVLVNSILSSTTFSGTGTFTALDTASKWYYDGSWVTSASQTISGIYAPQGIEAIIDESDPGYGDFQGLDRGTKPYACAIVRDMGDAGGSAGTNGDLTLMRIVNLLDAIDDGNAHSTSNLFGYCPKGVYNSLAQILRNHNQPTESMPSRDGLPSGLRFNYAGTDIPIIASKNCKSNTMFFPNKEHIFRYAAGEPRWEDTGGMLQRLEDYHGFQALYYGYYNFGTDLPEASGRLNDITEVTY